MAHKVYHGNPFKMCNTGTSVGVQWLRLCAPTVGGTGLIPFGGLRSHMPCSTVKNKKGKCAVQWYVVRSQHCCSCLPLFCFRSFSSSQKEILYLLSNHSPFASPPSLWQPLMDFLTFMYILFWTSHINGIIQHMASCVWLLSLNEVSRLIRILACTSTYFLLMIK